MRVRGSSGGEARLGRAPVLLVVLVCVAFLAPSLFLGRIPAQTDWLRVYGPWGEMPWTLETAPPHNPTVGDSFTAYGPDRLAAVNAWRAGEFPLWNPYVSGGTPFLGMQTATPLDPTVALQLALPPGPALGLGHALFLMLAGLGMVLYLRDRGLPAGPATVAGVAFAVNPYFLVWLESRVFVGGLAALPLCLWALERIVGTGPPGRSARRPAAVLGAALGVSVLAGTLQTLAILLLVPVLRLAWLVLGPGRLRPAAGQWVLLGGSVLAGLGIGALPLCAGIELLAHSTRLGSGGYYAEANALHWRAVGLWFNPAALGLPAEGDTLAAMHRQFLGGSAFGYLGAVPFALALLAVARRAGPAGDRRFWAGLGAVVLGLLLLQATPLRDALLGVFPWLSDVDVLRGLIVVNLSGCILAGAGAGELQRLWSGRNHREWAVPALVFLAAGLAAVAASRWGVACPRPLWQAEAPLLVLAAAVAGIALVPVRRDSHRLWLLTGVIAAELARLHFAVNTFAPTDTYYPRHKAVAQLDSMLTVSGHTRFLVEGHLRIFPPNTASAYGLADVRGYSTLSIGRYRALLECAEPGDTFLNLPWLDNLHSPIYRMLAVSHVFAIEPFESPLFERTWNRMLHRRRDALPRAYLVHAAEAVDGEAAMRTRLSDPAFDPARLVLLEAAQGPPPALEPQTAKESLAIGAPGTDRVTVRAGVSARAMLVLADAYYPGWRATVDGRPARILAANWGLRGVVLEPGTHEVEFLYRPVWLVPAAAASGAGLLCVLALAAPLPRRRRP